MVHVSFFANKIVVKLELNVRHIIMTIPTHGCLPSLKSLHVGGVDFVDNDSFRKLLFGCLVLEELFISSFKDFQNLINYSLANLHALLNAEMSVLHPRLSQLVDLDATTNLLNEISNVLSLSCNDDLLSALTLCKKPLPVFPNLDHLLIRR
ncbi:PREDICTED: putative F-box/LRR-repeat protein At3g59170 [Theobroma cacao]|uniref:F-box/LRR-repeat protein At3g59170 n=1 Tax=Theobroma cacao TaxID=3641 RepID=A0AB32WXV5_THECC|nr:PREDICTED: putative F-box/LRR-repeat protein At3g59170 [Theobroma cacao]